MAMGRALGAWLLAGWLAGCAMVPQPREMPALQGVPAAFEMSGRLSVRMADRSEIARLRWTREPGRDLWVIASPLGNEVARIESGAQGATLSGAANEAAPTFAELTERLLGVPLEPAQLAAWLHGSVPSEVAGGWKVVLDETQRAGTVDLARRLTASRGDVVVRVVVDDYRALGQ
jgi:outer membrane biogenesis lipoprotein LolB